MLRSILIISPRLQTALSMSESMPSLCKTAATTYFKDQTMCADSIKNIKSISFYFNKTLSYELSSLRWKLKENHIFVMFYIWNWKWKPLFPISSYIKCLGWFRHSTKIWVWQTIKLSGQLSLYFAYTLLRSWPFTVKTKRKLYVLNIFPRDSLIIMKMN